MKGKVLGDLGLHMAADDNVVTAIVDAEAGATLPYEGTTVELPDDVQFGHKIALVPLEPGDDVLKYGEVIGQATETVAPGEWVHTHNMESKRGRGDIAAQAEAN
ncbi:UxaA family hydrolase [Haloarcula marina]|uniref:UxaA family hydrolase n=1 Tax=Haloarcula marina TaxID=2961574 RepID=UPI0020B79C1E|nr:UxaA family hydrolase [Halomicroarcula marina]